MLLSPSSRESHATPYVLGVALWMGKVLVVAAVTPKGLRWPPRRRSGALTPPQSTFDNVCYSRYSTIFVAFSRTVACIVLSRYLRSLKRRGGAKFTQCCLNCNLPRHVVI